MIRLALTVATLLAMAGLVQAAYVIPARGGDNMDPLLAPMVHADVSYDGTTMTIALATEDPDPLHRMEVPILRPLTSPDEFEPGKVWTPLLTGKHYNYQWGWNKTASFVPPAGTSLWVEELWADPELDCYYGRKDMGTYAPIFGTLKSDGTPSVMQWEWIIDGVAGKMGHNTYAILNPTKTVYTATYRVYFAAPGTGSTAGFENLPTATTTLTFFTPEPASLAVLILGAAVLVRRRR